MAGRVWEENDPRAPHAPFRVPAAPSQMHRARTLEVYTGRSQRNAMHLLRR